MKICYLIDSHNIHVKRMADYFTRLGHEVHVVTHYNVFKNEKYKIHEIPLPKIHSKVLYGYFWAGFPKVLREIKKINPDILHGIYISNIALYIILANSYKKVITGIGDDILIWPQRDKYIKKLIKLAIGKSDRITVVSEYMKEELIKMGIKKNIIDNPLGVALSQFNLQGTKISTIKQKFGSKKIIISTRNLEPIYDVECLIKAFSYVIKQNNDVILLICGGGSLEDNLKRLVNNLGMDKYIHFLGKISHERMPDYLRSADIYVSTSLSDGTSISLLEAMACGIFPIVTDIPGNRPWVTHDKNGFLFEKGDYNKLSELILQSIGSKELIKNAAKINQEIVKEKGNWEKNIKEIENLYANLVERYC